MKPFYNLRRADDLTAAIRDLCGYWKLWSACLLDSCGLPVLSGTIVTRSTRKLIKDVPGILGEGEPSVSLIRHDKCPETPPYPRGGFLVSPRLLQEAVDFFFALDRIVAVYEEADPLLNMYNMNILFESDRKLWVEVVGPGFDASDLQRGDNSPHETFSASLEEDEKVSKVELVNRVDQSAYEQSVRNRKEKIINKLYAAPESNLACKIRADLGIPDDLEAHLKQIDSPLCRYNSYEPVRLDLVRGAIKRIIEANVISRYVELSGAKFPINFSASQVNRGRKLVFWDIVSPSLKYEGLSSEARNS
jgi:hypothetical protein